MHLPCFSAVADLTVSNSSVPYMELRELVYVMVGAGHGAGR